MILAMLSNLLWANSLIALRFYGEDFEKLSCDGSCKRKNKLVPLKTIPTDNPTPLENAAIDIPPVITVDVVRSVSMIAVIVLSLSFF